ncbi:hypothetical protein JTB14_016159 [Gonioctena quinquepunctata]|nr:hypothetical protein JTB14_016159 [Gonioctena quinquepunctata]
MIASLNESGKVPDSKDKFIMRVKGGMRMQPSTWIRKSLSDHYCIIFEIRAKPPIAQQKNQTNRGRKLQGDIYEHKLQLYLEAIEENQLTITYIGLTYTGLFTMSVN